MPGKLTLTMRSSVLRKMSGPAGMPSGFGFHIRNADHAGASVPGALPDRLWFREDKAQDAIATQDAAVAAVVLSPGYDAVPILKAEQAAQGLGLPPSAEASLGALIKREANAAMNEIAFRQTLSLAAFERGLDSSQRRALLRRALAWWGSVGGGQAAKQARLHIQSGLYTPMPTHGPMYVRTDVLSRSMQAAPLSRAYAPSTMTSATGPPEQKRGPKAQLQTRLPRTRKPVLQGLADPVHSVLSSRRALPAGSIRIHMSVDRGGYVRSMKMADGTWKLLGKIHPDHVTDEHKEAPVLAPAEVHPDSPPKGKEPVVDGGGNPVGGDGRPVAPVAAR